MDELIQSDMSSFPGMQAAEDEGKNKKKAKVKEPKQPRGPTAAQEREARKLAEEEERRQTAAERHAVMRRINQYTKDPNLAPRIDYKVPSENKMDKMSLEELYAVEDMICADLSEFGSKEMVYQVYVQAMGLAQDTLPAYFPQLGLQLSGPVADVKGSLAHPQTQEKLAPILAEIAVKYGRWFASGPEKRLILLTFQLFSQVHMANKTAAMARQHADQPVPADLAEEMEDI